MLNSAISVPCGLIRRGERLCLCSGMSCNLGEAPLYQHSVAISKVYGGKQHAEFCILAYSSGHGIGGEPSFFRWRLNKNVCQQAHVYRVGWECFAGWGGWACAVCLHKICLICIFRFPSGSPAGSGSCSDKSQQVFMFVLIFAPAET